MLQNINDTTGPQQLVLGRTRKESIVVWTVDSRVGVKYNWSSTQILQVLVIKYKYFAFSPIKYSST